MILPEYIEKPLIELWKKYRNEEYTKIPPLAVKQIHSDSIVFIGINPSLSQNEKNRLENSLIEIEFYDNYDSEKLHKYFNKFEEIANTLNVKWAHLDLLYIRETNQKVVENIINSEKGLNFIYEQLLISKNIIDKIIEQSNPLVFVVNNTLARKFLGKDKNKEKDIWIGYDFIWDEQIGTYRYKNIPFFFTSMLTGQRALDKGSFERLVWQIKRTL